MESSEEFEVLYLVNPSPVIIIQLTVGSFWLVAIMLQLPSLAIQNDIIIESFSLVCDLPIALTDSFAPLRASTTDWVLLHTQLVLSRKACAIAGSAHAASHAKPQKIKILVIAGRQPFGVILSIFRSLL